VSPFPLRLWTEGVGSAQLTVETPRQYTPTTRCAIPATRDCLLDLDLVCEIAILVEPLLSFPPHHVEPTCTSSVLLSLSSRQARRAYVFPCPCTGQPRRAATIGQLPLRTAPTKEKRRPAHLGSPCPRSEPACTGPAQAGSSSPAASLSSPAPLADRSPAGEMLCRYRKIHEEKRLSTCLIPGSNNRAGYHRFFFLFQFGGVP
jgi:hypothetical protein